MCADRTSGLKDRSDERKDRPEWEYDYGEIG